jgi:hypothetical protein
MGDLFRNRFLMIVILCAAMVALTCEEDTTEPEDGNTPRVNIYAGNNQSERVGSKLPEPLTVRVTNIIGDPFPGVPVEFSSTDPGAVVTPAIVSADIDGFASCTFTLGSAAGAQHVKAVISGDSTLFSAAAVAVGCDEEDPERVCNWPAAHIFITTTSSTLITGRNQSILIDYNPDNLEIIEVLQTEEEIIDLSFSSRGELFLTSSEKIFKVDPVTKTLEEYGSYPAAKTYELVENYGGIMAGISENEIFMVDCPTSFFSILYNSVAFFVTVREENFAVDPVTRDLYLIKGTAPFTDLYEISWDGRSIITDSDLDGGTSVDIGNGMPNGMCADSSGTVYITIDGNNTYRRIYSVSASKVIEVVYDYWDEKGAMAGRWGDIAVLYDYLFIIDTRNNGLAKISKNGMERVWHYSEQFSRDLEENERYGIAASPTWLCAGDGR